MFGAPLLYEKVMKSKQTASPKEKYIAPKKPEKGKMKIEKGFRLEPRIASKIRDPTCIFKRYLSLVRKSMVLFKGLVGGKSFKTRMF